MKSVTKVAAAVQHLLICTSHLLTRNIQQTLHCQTNKKFNIQTNHKTQYQTETAVKEIKKMPLQSPVHVVQFVQ